MGDQCANCGTRLAPDQRYCVECGERRGKPRYSLAGGTSRSASSPARARPQRLPRLSGNGALIAGVGVLLLAMAVGLQIGLTVRSPGRAPEVKVVGLGGGTAATGTGGAASTPASTGAATTGTKKSSKSSKSAPKTAIAKKIAKAAKSVPKTIPKKLQSQAQKVGGACSGGPGCSNGKFTGNFFGGG